MTSDTSSPTAHLDAETVGYKQSLGRRQVQMIAIGGAIGTGLFLGSASRLNSNGPALLVSYAFAGLVAYFLMRALGELVLHRSTSGAFVSYMREFFGEKAAYVTGWMYWLNWALTGVAELSAVGVYVHDKFESMPNWLSALIALGVVLGVNLLSAKAFGEFEFWASILKVGAIVLFLVVGLVVVLGAVHVGDHQAGFSNLWDNPGGFWPTSGAYNWYGPILVMSGVVFAYAAIEMVGVAAGEMEDAETEVPRAVNAVIFRIAVFYIGSILLMCAMLPTTSYTADTSPFVTVFQKLGFGWMGDVIQVVLIVAAMSSLNSGLYSTGRVLRSLGMSKQAPGFTTRMSTGGVPWAGIALTTVVYVLGVVLNVLVPGRAFDIALEASSIGITFTWGTIFACQLKLRSLVNKGIIPKGKFQAPGYPYTSVFGLVFLVAVIVALGISGWLDKSGGRVDFWVVVVGIPLIAAALTLGWFCIRGNVVDHTKGRIGPAWAEAEREHAARTLG
ncbi:amino acid permease [Williamsia sp. SKLECPSW1]